MWIASCNLALGLFVVAGLATFASATLVVVAVAHTRAACSNLDAARILIATFFSARVVHLYGAALKRERHHRERGPERGNAQKSLQC